LARTKKERKGQGQRGEKVQKKKGVRYSDDLVKGEGPVPVLLKGREKILLPLTDGREKTPEIRGERSRKTPSLPSSPRGELAGFSAAEKGPSLGSRLHQRKKGEKARGAKRERQKRDV